MNQAPHVFLSSASEDKELAVRLAKDLLARGIDTFNYIWDIKMGESFRQRIDEGITNCTHFLVLLTPVSIRKPWVNAEIDAAFVQRFEGRCKLIPVRYGLSASELPPLLSGLYSPSLDNYETDLYSLICYLYGVNEKPPLGTPPVFQAHPSSVDTGLSRAAALVAQVFIHDSEHGIGGEPQVSLTDIQARISLSEQAVVDATSELEEQGLVSLRQNLNAKGFDALSPTDRLFVALDKHYVGWDPETDALKIAAHLVNSEKDGENVQHLAEMWCWSTRRINPAINYLVESDLVMASDMISLPYARNWIRSNNRTRRWVNQMEA